MTSTKLNSDPVKSFAVGTPDKIIEPQIKKTNDDTKNLFNIIVPSFYHICLHNIFNNNLYVKSINISQSV